MISSAVRDRRNLLLGPIRGCTSCRLLCTSLSHNCCHWVATEVLTIDLKSEYGTGEAPGGKVSAAIAAASSIASQTYVTRYPNECYL
jgi:hypothetical protein